MMVVGIFKKCRVFNNVTKRKKKKHITQSFLFERGKLTNSKMCKGISPILLIGID